MTEYYMMLVVQSQSKNQHHKIEKNEKQMCLSKAIAFLATIVKWRGRRGGNGAEQSGPAVCLWVSLSRCFVAE